MNNKIEKKGEELKKGVKNKEEEGGGGGGGGGRGGKGTKSDGMVDILISPAKFGCFSPSQASALFVLNYKPLFGAE